MKTLMGGSPVINKHNAGQKAREGVYKLLKLRIYSEQEIRDRLTRKNYSHSVTEETIGYFKKLDLINDRQFAQQWISSRLSKPFGAERILFELKEKGVAQGILNQELAQAMKDHPEEQIVFHLAKQRLAKLKGIDESKMKQRIYGFLKRRGFRQDIIDQTIERL